MTGNGKGALETLSGPTNDGAPVIESEQPYTMRVEITGAAPLLFHAWSDDAVAAKAAAHKGSKAKKEDDTQSYVYRDERGHICMPGEYLRGAAWNAAKFRQDPRAPRRQAVDLYKAALVPMTMLAPVIPMGRARGTKDWDYLDRRRVIIQRSAISRHRPAFAQGWKATIELMVTLPEYVSPTALHDVLSLAGRTIGVGDFRPTFGRFQVTRFERVA